MRNVFVVHQTPDKGRYGYDTDPNDAIATAKALLALDTSGWVAGNCRRMISVGDLVLFKIGSARGKYERGIYAAGHVSQVPASCDDGLWRFGYVPHKGLIRRLIKDPIVGAQLAEIVPRSFGASIQVVPDRGVAALENRFGTRLLKNGRAAQEITHALFVLKEPLDDILAGRKTWEMRRMSTKIRGRIGLIESRSGTVVGTCDIVDVNGPLSLASLRANARRMGCGPDDIERGHAGLWAWVLTGARRLRQPIPYKHRRGVVTWALLDPPAQRLLQEEEWRHAGNR